MKAADTGYYEFRVRTENGARLYVNNDETGGRRKLRDDSSVAGQSALIDAWVGSGEMREVTARRFLVGGRRYPLRLEFFKYREPTASIRLEWKRPFGTWEVLDARHLVAIPAERVFVVDTPFPPDDRSLGYERGSSVSREWHEATTRAAVATANEIVDRLPLLASFNRDAADRMETLSDFFRRMARVAFRRALTDDETAFVEAMWATDSENLETAARRTALWILTSPHFLYTELPAVDKQPNSHIIAARLALLLWDSIPDRPLREAADAGALSTRAGIEAEARRMIADPRARAKARRFFQAWLELDERDLAKDKQLFPDFDESVIADLRTSLELFIDNVLWSEGSDYRELLLADYLMLNDRLLALYGEGGATADAGSHEATIDPPTEEEPTEGIDAFNLVRFAPTRRSGVLTHPYLLSAFAYHNSTSPIHRGVFLTRNIVGRDLQPPPEAVALDNEAFPAGLTMRQKITELTRDKACMACHSIINPLGFAMERYDAVGRFRTHENGKEVDALSEYTTEAGVSLEIGNPRDIATFAAESSSASRGFVSDFFKYLTKQRAAAYGDEALDELHSHFADNHFSMQEQWIRIAVVAATHGADTLLEETQEP